MHDRVTGIFRISLCFSSEFSTKNYILHFNLTFHTLFKNFQPVRTTSVLRIMKSVISYSGPLGLRPVFI